MLLLSLFTAEARGVGQEGGGFVRPTNYASSHIFYL